MKVEYLLEAAADARREARFWKSQSPRLKDAFIEELANAVQTITQAPNGYLLVSKAKELRRFHEKRFHTNILYRYEEKTDTLIVARIYNARMNPTRFLD